MPYFASIGSVMSADSNPAEFMVDLVNDAFTSRDKVDAVLSAWTNNGAVKTTSQVNEVQDQKSGVPADRVIPSFMSQLNTLLKRHGLLVVRDPVLYLSRCFMFFVLSVFFSIIYIQHS